MAYIILDEDLYISTDMLAKYYAKKENILSQYDWPASGVGHYTPLTIICLKANQSYSEATDVVRMLISMEAMTHGYLDGLSAHGEITENVSDLFSPFEKSYSFVILIEGSAGIGKSTLCREIALQWANKYILQNKTLLFLLSMNDPKIKNLTSVETIVNHFFQSEILAHKINKWLIKTKGKYLTIVIDEYSEDCGNTFITNEIVSRKILSECSLVIASRSVPSSHLSKIVKQRAVILGFTKESQNIFIDNILKGSYSKINCLKDYLTSNPIIHNLCNTPLIMNLLLYFVEEGMNKLPTTHGHISLIQKYILTIIKNKSITTLTELPHPYDEVIKDLSQFAFVAIQNHSTFTVDDILESSNNQFKVYWHGLAFQNKIFELGLLNKICFQARNVDSEIYYFCHVTFQEYLAAYYISSLPDDELLKLLGSTFLNICYLNVWITYVSLSGCNNFVFKDFLSNSQDFETSDISVKSTNHAQEAGDNLDSALLGQDIDLKHQKLSHEHLRIFAVLLSKSTNKQWKSLKLSHCDIDSKGCTIIFEMLSSNVDLKFEIIDISYNNFCWESFYEIGDKLKNSHLKKLVFSVNSLYSTMTVNKINSFTALLEKYFHSIEFSDGILLLTYAPEQNKLIAVYSAPTRIRWFQWTDCKMNADTLNQVKHFVETEVGTENFKTAFSYSLVDHHANNEGLSTLLSDIQNVHLCGTYLHSKGAYLLNIACTISCQYNSPQESIADYLAAVMCYNVQAFAPLSYLQSLPVASATVVEDSFKNLSVFDISGNYIDSQIATEIATVLSLTSTLQAVRAYANNLLTENAIKIAKSLQNCSALFVFNMSNNNIGEEAADDIATVLSHNTKLQELNLNNNNFKTVGMIKITKALQSTSTLIEFYIENNNVGEEAADDIASVLSHNTKLQELNLNNNNFKTVGMIKIAKALQNTSTLVRFDIGNNNLSEEAADDIATVLFHNTKLEYLYLNDNNIKTAGMIKITKALQNTSTLIEFYIENNNVGEEAADDIATVLSYNTKLQGLNLNDNNFKTVGMVKIAKALQHISTLIRFGIENNNVGEEAADDIATVLSYNTKLQGLNLNDNNFKTVGMIKIAKALQNISTLIEFYIEKSNVGEEAADDIATVLSHNTKLEYLYLNDNNFKTVGMIKIVKALQNTSTLIEFYIENNNVGEEAADDIATVLSHNTKLQDLNLSDNNFKTVGMIKIAKALQNTSTLIRFGIGNNDLGEEAADDIATVLSHNTKLQGLNLSGNNVKTVGMIKITRALQDISTLIEFYIGNNNVGEEAVDDIATILSHNTNLQKLHLNDNNFKTVGMIKFAKALQNISTLIWFDIGSNNVGEEAADDIAAVLSYNTKLQKVNLCNNNFQATGAIKITEALRSTLTLEKYDISHNNIGEFAVATVTDILSWNTKLNLQI